MITQLSKSHGAVLGFKVSGDVSLAEEKVWLKKLEDVIAEHKKIRILILLEESADWSMDAGLADLRWAFTHMKNFEKLAIVSSSIIWRWLVNIDGVFASMMGIGEKHFEISELHEAWDWLEREE